MSSELNSPIPVHFSSQIPRMSMFTLAISCLTTFNLPWSWTWHSRFLCSIALYIIWPCFYYQSHPQLGVVFMLAPSFLSFWSYFSTLLQHIGHLLTWGFHHSVPYLFAFSYCSWGSQGKNTEVVCHSLLQWTMFCQNSSPWPINLGWSYIAWLTELDKAAVHVISMISFPWLWFSFCLSSER